VCKCLDISLDSSWHSKFRELSRTFVCDPRMQMHRWRDDDVGWSAAIYVGPCRKTETACRTIFRQSLPFLHGITCFSRIFPARRTVTGLFTAVRYNGRKRWVQVSRPICDTSLGKLTIPNHRVALFSLFVHRKLEMLNFDALSRKIWSTDDDKNINGKYTLRYMSN